MNVECMREQVAQVYPYPKWQQKVARMHEPQVVAVYKSLMRRNALFTHRKEKPEIYHQISIWEWLKENERNGTNQKR